MLRKLSLIFSIFFLFSLSVSSQTKTEEEDYVSDNVLKYDDVNYKPYIKTVQIHESTWEYAIPAIDFNSNQSIELSFDDIEGDQKQYSLTFQHCNADWTPSDLMISEYMSGFFDLNIINFSFSMNTLQKYTHYSIMFPQQNLKLTKTGNYIVYVYKDGDKKDLVLSRRFMVFENKVTVAHTFRQSNEDQFQKQHIDFSIYHSGYDITNPYADLKVVLMQNNRWENAVTNIKPTFLGGGQLTYSLDDASTFNGGNEFRYFDIRSMRFYTEKVKEIYRDETLKNHVVLYPDELRTTKPYLFYSDFNGNFLIKNRDAIGNQDTEADYVYVDFFLPYKTPESAGNFYVLGKLTDWRMNKKSKMTYNYKRLGYEAQLYLKQGFYNYMYVLSNDAKKGGDETLIEGSHWDTENDYSIYVYHRKIGTYYDQLICYKKFNSLKK
ncbi:MAG: hypothetical protein K0S32_538 [Bacteroidetes bacterium]|jgi:hypothetical protein|nr:hypothetical protein [Bacteroidota bacterium]